MESESEGQSTAMTDQEGAAANHEDQEGASANHEDQEGASANHEDQEGASANQEEQDAPSAHEQDGASSSDQEDRGDEEEGGGGEDGGDDEEGGGPGGGAASGRSLASAIEDVSSLPGETINDQDGRKIGEVKEIYAVGENETPMWVTIESATGLGRNRHVFVPLARIKNQGDEIRVPYSYGHIHESPEVEAEDELSEEDDRALRAYYAIGLADQELVGSAQSYASQVPDEEGAARKIDSDAAEGQVREIDDTPPAERVAEAYEKQKEEEGEEHRKGRDATADDVFEEDGAGDAEGKDQDKDDGEEEGEKEEGEKEEGEKD